MARSITPYAVANSAVTNLTSGASSVTISSSPVFQIPANSSITVSVAFTFNDLDNGYVAASAVAVDVDASTGTVLGFGATFGGSLSVNSVKTLTNSTASPINIRVDISAQCYFANTRTQITNFTPAVIQLYSGEVLSRDTIPDNDVSAPNNGVVIRANASTSSWVTIVSVQTPSFPCFVAINATAAQSTDGSGSYPWVFTYQHLVDSTVVDEYDVVYTDRTSNQIYPKFTTETSSSSTVSIRVRVKTQGASGNFIAHNTSSKVVMRLDQIGAYTSQMITSSTAVSSTDILKTPVMTTTTNNYVLAVLTYTANATQSLYRGLRLPYATVDNTTGLDGSQITGGSSLDFGAAAPAGNMGRGDHVLIFRKATSTSMDFALRQDSTNISMTLRPGSGIYIMDLSAEPIPTETYDPICWLHAS